MGRRRAISRSSTCMGSEAPCSGRGHVRVGRELGAAGYTVIAGNNRGSGLATPLPTRDGVRLGGAWFERLEDAAEDLDAWIDLALASGARRIVLLGHSLGAVKALLYTSTRPRARRADPRLSAAPRLRRPARRGSLGEGP